MKRSCLGGVLTIYLLAFLLAVQLSKSRDKRTKNGNLEALAVAKELQQAVWIIYSAGRLKSSLKEPLKMAPALKLMLAVRFFNTTLAANLICLSNDVALNPGPIDLRVSSQGRGVTVGQWNIQHLTETKFEQLSLSLNAHKDSGNKVDLLILTETFCNSKRPDSFYQVHGYDLFRKDRVRKKGGGIITYVNNKLHAITRPDLMTTEIEMLWIEICPFKSKRSMLIAGVYRPPSSTSQDDANIAKNIEKAYLLNKEMVLLGDFNIDFLNANQANKHKLVKTLTNLHLTQLVKEVTRPASGTCLDHIWTSHPGKNDVRTNKDYCNVGSPSNNGGSTI